MPTGAGIFNFTVKVTDTDGVAGAIKYQLMIIPTTSANAVIGGKVLTAKGNAIKNATVILTDTNGNSVRTRTGEFGNYRFSPVGSGQTYTITIVSKRFTFNPSVQVRTVNGDALDVDFTAQE